MKAVRLAFLLALGFILRSLALLLWGSGGVSEYGKVQAYRELLAANIEELKGINAGLRRELAALSSDPERVALAARQLGYFRDGERVFRFQAGDQPKSSFVLGRLVRASPRPERRDWVWKLAGLAAPPALYMLYSLRRRRRRHANRSF